MKRPAMKFCGITRTEDAWAAADNGAAAIGFVFAKGSPRLVTPDAARVIGRTLPPFLQRVGVFVDATPADVRAVATFAELDVVQLHGHESVQDAASAWPRVIKALARGRDLLEQAEAWSDEVTLLVDAATRRRARRHGAARRLAGGGGSGARAACRAGWWLDPRQRRRGSGGGPAVRRRRVVGDRGPAGSEIGQPHAGVRLGGRIGVEAG